MSLIGALKKGVKKALGIDGKKISKAALAPSPSMGPGGEASTVARLRNSNGSGGGKRGKRGRDSTIMSAGDSYNRTLLG